MGEEGNGRLRDLGANGLATVRLQDCTTARQLNSDQFMMAKIDFHVNLDFFSLFACHPVKVFSIIGKNYSP